MPSARRPGGRKPISGRSRVPRVPFAPASSGTNLARFAECSTRRRACPFGAAQCKQPALLVVGPMSDHANRRKAGRPASHRGTCRKTPLTWVAGGMPFTASPEREGIRVAGDDLAGNDCAEADEGDTGRSRAQEAAAVWLRRWQRPLWPFAPEGSIASVIDMMDRRGLRAGGEKLGPGPKPQAICFRA